MTTWEPSRLPTHLYQSFFVSPPNVSNNISMFWYCWSLSTLITLTLLLTTNLTSLFPSWFDTFQHTRTRPIFFSFGLLLTVEKSRLILQVPGNVSRYIFYPESYLQEWEPTIFQLIPLLNPYVLGIFTIFSKLKIESLNPLVWFFFFSQSNYFELVRHRDLFNCLNIYIKCYHLRYLIWLPNTVSRRSWDFLVRCHTVNSMKIFLVS